MVRKEDGACLCKDNRQIVRFGVKGKISWDYNLQAEKAIHFIIKSNDGFDLNHLPNYLAKKKNINFLKPVHYKDICIDFLSGTVQGEGFLMCHIF